MMAQSAARERPLQGLSVLVAEDDYFIAIEMCSALRAAGANVIGPARDLQTGLAAIRDERIDCGVLDINLRGQLAFELATELRARNVPAIFATGYGASMIPAALADAVRLEKPVDFAALCRAIETACL
jgi:DNA-binding response OmpR family regulator